MEIFGIRLTTKSFHSLLALTLLNEDLCTSSSVACPQLRTSVWQGNSKQTCDLVFPHVLLNETSKLSTMNDKLLRGGQLGCYMFYWDVLKYKHTWFFLSRQGIRSPNSNRSKSALATLTVLIKVR